MIDLEIWQYFLLLGLGGLSGFLNVIAGGGSLIVMPALIFMSFPAALANGTVRVSLLAQNIFAVKGFARQGHSDFKLSSSMALCAIPGALLGAFYGTKIDEEIFNRILAVVIIAVIVFMNIKKASVSLVEPETSSRPKILLTHFLMVIMGFYGGFIQAGVGFILIATLSWGLQIPLLKVNMHKVFIVGVYTFGAVIIFASQGAISWVPALCLAIGNSIGAWIATIVSVKKGENFIKFFLNIVLFAMALKLIWSSL